MNYMSNQIWSMDFLLIYFDIPYCNIYFNNSFHKLIDVQVSITNYKMND